MDISIKDISKFKNQQIIQFYMTKWVCTGCNFRFESGFAKECPYCSRKNIEKEPSAEELLDEVERLLEE